MFRPAVRQALRTSAPRSLPRTAHSRRLLSTAPPHARSRSWKNSAVRWGLAGALVYYYNTSPVFAEEPAYAIHAPPETQQETETYPTLDAVAAERKVRAKSEEERAASEAPSTAVGTQVTGEDAAAPGSPDELQEEASQQGAFNEETGEINWDCPCLGGMAYGPCGEQFRDAFSCFVFSQEEPKGVDCIEKFKTMQDCFRQHPEIYGSELEEEEVEGELSAGDAASPVASEPSEPEASAAPSSANIPDGNGEKVADRKPDHPDNVQAKRERSQAAGQQVKEQHTEVSESDSVMPKAWHDGR